MTPPTLGTPVGGCYPPTKSNVTRLSQYRGSKATNSMARILVIEAVADHCGEARCLELLQLSGRNLRADREIGGNVFDVLHLRFP